MKYLLDDIKNNFDFFIRQKLNFSRKNYSEKNEPKQDLFASETIVNREKILLDKYNFMPVKLNSSRSNYLENLYTLDILDRYFDIKNKESMSVLDVGCKNWFYAKGEYFFFNQKCNHLALDGIELDANRLYSNLYSRSEAAKFYTKGLHNVNYFAGDFLNQNQKYDYIVWILPFVVEYPLIKWGLPKKYFKPEKMLKHAFDSLNSGGKMLIINQGEAEYEAQIALCEALKIPHEKFGLISSDFYDYTPRYLSIISN